jgi:hypothetical protein
MTTKGLSRWFFIAALAGFLTLLTTWTAPAHAQFHTAIGEPKCISCHEDLYFLHDTGKWFCLNEETSMTCVGCHGGDPVAITKEVAHVNRAAHPIINENISKCSECHPEQSLERTETFAREAGISLVRVSTPYQSLIPIAEKQSFPMTKNAQNARWLPAIAGMFFFLVISLALVVYILFRVYRGKNLKP